MSPRSQVQRPTKFFIIEELTWQFNGKLNFLKALKLKKNFFQQMILEQMVVCVCTQLLSDVQFFVTAWTVACQSLLSLGFFRQED